VIHVKLLVTGGLGFVGSNFIRYVLSKHEDVQVTNLDNCSYGSNSSSLKDLEDSDRYTFVRGDISDLELIAPIVSTRDVVVNFAASTHVDRSIADPSESFRSNTTGTLALLESARKKNGDPLFLQVGTDEVYGDVFEGLSSENDALNPSSPYAATKAAADMLLLAYHRTYGVKTILTRCTNNFGPYQFPEKLIPKTIIRAMNNLTIPLYGSGKQVRDWIYVADHCEALDLAIRKGRPGSIYNIAGGNQTDNLRLVKTILKTLDKPEKLIQHVEDRPGHDMRYALDGSKIKNELGWQPRHNFENALQTTIQWYKTNENWWKPITDDNVLSETPWKLKW
jgi:dTDP-glucose 4,6-dehydratase